MVIQFNDKQSFQRILDCDFDVYFLSPTPHLVNQERLNRQLPPLKIEVINVISPTETEVDEVSLKISSTYIRQYLSERASKASAATGTVS